MAVLNHLKPEKVFQYFEEICAIPHGSGNMERISDYLVSFARERGLEYYQDEVKNVIIIKEATEGRRQDPPMMLQGHMDMVAVKTPDSKIDMEREGLRLQVEGDEISARDTSLGGDDGIAVAYVLALLDSDDISHPRLEAVLTVDEEVGLIGASRIDIWPCRATQMINLDAEEEGYFFAGCAGGMRVNCALPVSRTKEKGILCELAVGGLQGGHSGAEIHKERGNSNVLMGRLLTDLTGRYTLRLVALSGGLADNAIARDTSATVLIQAQDMEGVTKAVAAMEDTWKKEYATKDPEVSCRIRFLGEQETEAVTPEDTKKATVLLFCLPNGVIAMSADVEGLVETSLNLGILKLEDGQLVLGYSVRSSLESAKHMVKDRLFALTGMLGGSCTTAGDYPGWAYRKESPLRDKAVAVYREMYKKEPVVGAIHAGLECGFFLGKRPELDCISLGPDMKNIHTTEETMSISSVARVWEYLIQMLA